jgi:hypothetical protein
VRILIIDPYYPRFLAHALESIDSSSLGYEEMLTQLLRLRFGTSDFYSRHLRNLGHDAHDVIFNCEPLQRRWAEERGVAIGATTLRIPARAARLPIIRRWLAPRDPLVEIALRQIRSARPDVLYFQVLNVFPPEILRSLKDSGCLIVGQIASPLPPADYLKAFDLILTSFPHYVDRLRDMESPRNTFASASIRSCSTAQSGTAGTLVHLCRRISPAHSARTRFLEQLARAVDMEFWLRRDAGSIFADTAKAPR